MARGINKVTLVGNLGNDPETRYTNNGTAVTTISVATSSSWKDKKTGEKQEHTEWHRVVFFGKLAEIVAEYLSKGSQVYLEGALRTQKWEDKEGVTRYKTEVVANELNMLGGARRTEAAPAAASTAAPADSALNITNDDIPF